MSKSLHLRRWLFTCFCLFLLSRIWDSAERLGKEEQGSGLMTWDREVGSHKEVPSNLLLPWFFLVTGIKEAIPLVLGLDQLCSLTSQMWAAFFRLPFTESKMMWTCLLWQPPYCNWGKEALLSRGLTPRERRSCGLYYTKYQVLSLTYCLKLSVLICKIGILSWWNK